MSEKSKNKITNGQIRIITYGIIGFIILCFMIYQPALNKFNIAIAENCYKAQNYLCAFKFYKSAFSSEYDNQNFVSHYVDTLSRLKKVAMVQEELTKLMETYPDNEAISEIEAIFTEIKKSLNIKEHDTYIEHVMLGPNIVHWNNYAGRIKVYIDRKNNAIVPSYYFDEVKEALQDYTKAMDNTLKFTYTENKADADIEIYFVEKLSGGQCANSTNCVNILGLTETDIAGSNLKKVTLQLRITDVDDSKFTANQIHNIAKHELGHALGIAGHSYYTEDVMYPINNDAEWAIDTATLLIKRKEFSTRDIATLKLLYKIIPDVTNGRYDTKIHSDMYFPTAVLGNRKEMGEKKLQESEQYLSAVSTNFISQMNLAEGYFVNRDLNNAAIAFEKALNLAETNEEKFTIYHNLAVINYEKGNYKNALTYADIANTYNTEKKSNEIKAYCYIELKQYAQAEQLLEVLVRENTDNITYSSALTGVYLKQYKFIKMLKELKRIKKASPGAFSDKLFAPYKFFTRLV